MSDTTVTHYGYTIERRQCVTEIKDHRGIIVVFAVAYLSGAWTVTVLPWIADPAVCPTEGVPDDHFVLPDRDQAERLLGIIAKLHAGQQRAHA